MLVDGIAYCAGETTVRLTGKYSDPCNKTDLNSSATALPKRLTAAPLAGDGQWLVDSRIAIPDEKGQDGGVMGGSSTSLLPLSIILIFLLEMRLCQSLQASNLRKTERASSRGCP